MKLNPTLLAICAGLASGVIFAVSSAFSTLGTLLIYLSLFPLLLLGLGNGARHAAIACVAGCIMAALLVRSSDGLFYPLFVVLPVMLFLRLALSFRGENGQREWYPVMRIVSVLAAIAAGIFMTSAILASLGQPGGLQGMVANELADNLTSSDQEVAATMKLLLTDWLFLLLAGTAWLWLMALYALASLANALLARNGAALRPSLHLSAYGLPRWLLFLLALSAFFAFAGTGNDRLNGETTFLILLLPYFFAGMACIHQASRGWPARTYLLAGIYFLLMFPPWMAFIAVTLGVYVQLREVLDKRPRIG